MIIYCNVKSNRLVDGLKFNRNKVDEYIKSIDGLKEFMEYHYWTKLPLWVFSKKGKAVMVATVEFHKEVSAMEAEMKIDSM